MANSSPLRHNLERKLATILSADVAGYSRLMAEDEEQTLRIFRGHKEVFESLVAMHKGRIFNTAGDAILAEFGSAVEAVRCATEIQAALQTRNRQFPPERQVNFRIGVNLGDVIVQGQDLLGDGVNVAARLQTAAVAGGICISGSVYDQIRNKLSLSFNLLGEKSFKNIPQPVRTFSITEAEGHGRLPSPERGHSHAAGWVVAAVLLLALAAGAYWIYSKNERIKVEQAHSQFEAAKPAVAQPEAEPAPEKPALPRVKATPAKIEREPNISAEHVAAVTGKNAGTPSPIAANKTEQPAQDAAARNVQTPAPVAVKGIRAEIDGIYSGRMCFGAIAGQEAHCFRSQATLANGKLSGQWDQRAGWIMYLVGEVSPSGEVQIHMHNENNGVRKARIEMTGKLHDGRLEATGAFLNGRTASVEWRKKPISPP